MDTGPRPSRASVMILFRDFRDSFSPTTAAGELALDGQAPVGRVADEVEDPYGCPAQPYAFDVLLAYCC